MASPETATPATGFSGEPTLIFEQLGSELYIDTTNDLPAGQDLADRQARRIAARFSHPLHGGSRDE